MMVCLAMVSMAQPPRTRPIVPAEERAERVTRRLNEKLAFENAQRERVYLINLQTSREIQAIMKAARESERSREELAATREQLRDINQGRAEAIEAELSEEQTARFEEMKKEFKARRKERLQRRIERLKENQAFWEELENDG